MRYLITFSYDGTNFEGYQIQPELRTVQGCLEKALTFINQKKETKVVASGRTDKGVHAIHQKAHFDLQVEITIEKLKRALNSNLPDDIYVKNVEKVDEEFHARYMVKEKEYRYYLNLGEYNPLERNYVFQCCHSLDIEKIKEGITYFLGTHDFRAFVTENVEKENCVRTISDVKVEIDDNNHLVLIFKGSGFLKYQVRNMVGLLIRIGERKRDVVDVRKMLEAKKRIESTPRAPACGLYLIDVIY